MSISEAASSGNRLTTLETLRDRLASEVDACANPRDLPALVLRLTDVMQQIESMPTSRQVSRADEIAERRAARRGSGSTHKTRTTPRIS